MINIWERADAGSIGRRFNEPIVMVPGNAKSRRRWRRRNVPNAQKMAHAAHVIWRERVEPMQHVPPVVVNPESPALVEAMHYMTDALRGAP